MTRTKALCLLAAATLLAAPGYPGDCWHTSGVVTAGRDADGYFIRVSWPPTAERSHVDVSPAGDYLAGAAGVTILYRKKYTDKVVESGVWRGPDPRAALDAFSARSGLIVDGSSPGLWVIRGASMPDYGAVTITARPIDAEHQRSHSVAQLTEIERALLDQLPVRDLYDYGDRVAMELSYYWLPDEGNDVLLVVCKTRSIGGPFWGVSPFKVRIEHSGDGVRVVCLWAANGVAGGLVPAIAEDFDGDGYRDFVFAPGGTRVFVQATIISGKDGKTLLKFGGGELAVERSGAGPKRIAATLFEPDSEEVWPTRLLRFDATQREYVPEEADTMAANANAAPVTSSKAKVADLLAQEVGERGNVEVYNVQEPAPSFLVDEAMISKGFPATVLCRYESHDFIADQKKNEEELRTHPPTPLQVTVTTKRDKPLVPRVGQTPSPTPAAPNVH
jgi:hypothetical protein